MTIELLAADAAPAEFARSAVGESRDREPAC
jgi:hypothetical protein